MKKQSEEKIFGELLMGEGTKVRELLGRKYSVDILAEVLNELDHQTEDSLLNMSEFQFDMLLMRLRHPVDSLYYPVMKMIESTQKERVDHYINYQLNKAFETNDKELFMKVTNEMKSLRGGDKSEQNISRL